MAGILSDFDGECKAGDMAGPFEMMSIVKKRGTLVGSGLRQVCVSVVSDDDVRCYQQCQYGQGIKRSLYQTNKLVMHMILL